MKSIKFRAWLKDEKKMIDVKAIDFDENGDVFSVNYPEGKSYCGYDRDNIELMQYTGLKDKNGVKIFEGDIIKYTFEYDNNNEIYHRERILIVVYQKEWCRFILEYAQDDGNWDSFCEVDLEELEVIGNIYENPELLGD